MKRFLGTLMAAAMLISFSIIALAKTDAYDADVQPRTYPCDRCSNGQLFPHNEYATWWTTIYSLVCSHGYSIGHDEDHKRDVYEVWECDSCGFTSRARVDSETRNVCYGRDI